MRLPRSPFGTYTSTRFARRRLLLACAALFGSASLASCNLRWPDPELERFLRLSAWLTGLPVDRLDRAAGRAYLASLRSDPTGRLLLGRLEEAAGGGSGAAPNS